MTFKEIEAMAKELADRAILLSPENGDKLIRSEALKFPEGIKRLLLQDSARFAEQKRIFSTMAKHTKELAEASRNHTLKVWGARVGVGGLLLALLVVLIIPHPSTPQMIVIRLIAAMGAAGFASVLTGFLEIKAKWGILVIIGGGGFAVFWLTYFYNPPAVTP